MDYTITIGYKGRSLFIGGWKGHSEKVLASIDKLMLYNPPQYFV